MLYLCVCVYVCVCLCVCVYVCMCVCVCMCVHADTDPLLVRSAVDFMVHYRRHPMVIPHIVRCAPLLFKILAWFPTTFAT